MRQRKQDRDGLYQRRRSPYWWATYTDERGNRVRRSTGTADRREAEALLARWRLEAYRVRQWGEEPTRTYDDLMLRYLETVTPTKRSAERDYLAAKRLTPFFTGMALHELKRATIREYVAVRRGDGAAAATINKELNTLSAALRWAQEELEWRVPNPVTRVPVANQRTRWLTAGEAERLIAAAEASTRAPHLADFIRLALATGMRKGELLGLTWDRVDWANGLIYLGTADQKSGRVGSVPLNAPAREALRGRWRFRNQHCPEAPEVFVQKNGRPVQWIRNAFMTACRRAGLADVRIHDLRHTAGSWLTQAGVPLRTVAEVLRHADIQTTMRYAHLAPESAREALSQIEAVMSQSGHTETAVEGSDSG